MSSNTLSVCDVSSRRENNEINCYSNLIHFYYNTLCIYTVDHTIAKRHFIISKTVELTRLSTWLYNSSAHDCADFYFRAFKEALQLMFSRLALSETFMCSKIVILEHLSSAVWLKKSKAIDLQNCKQSTKATKKYDSLAYSGRPLNIHLEYIKAASKETKNH